MAASFPGNIEICKPDPIAAERAIRNGNRAACPTMGSLRDYEAVPDESQTTKNRL
jgi:hypothetical protein